MKRIGFCLAMAAAMLWSLTCMVGCLQFVYEGLGILGAIVGLFMLPGTIAIVPIYALVVDHNWQPILFVYGGGFLLTVLLGALLPTTKSAAPATGPVISRVYNKAS